MCIPIGISEFALHRVGLVDTGGLTATVARPDYQATTLSSYQSVKQSSSQAATVAHPSCQTAKLTLTQVFSSLESIHTIPKEKSGLGRPVWDSVDMQ